jgi:multidrug resistance efflux pump
VRSGERPEQRQRLEAAVRAADAKLANARVEFNRSDRLLRSNAIARSVFDRDEVNLRVAQEEHRAAVQALEKGTIGREEDVQAQEAEVRGLEARVVEANLHLTDSTLLAPYDGVIAQRFVEQNQNVRAKDPIVKFQDVDEIDVAVDVPETVMIADLRSADIVRLVADFSGARTAIPGPVGEVAPASARRRRPSGSALAMKVPPDVNLLPGMTATVTAYRRAASWQPHPRTTSRPSTRTPRGSKWRGSLTQIKPFRAVP